MWSVVRSVLVPFLLAGALAGCGGGISFVVGDDDDDWWDPGWDSVFSGRTATLDVNASDDVLDGTWSTGNTELTQVRRFGETGGEPETCRFQFYGLRQQGEGRFLDGEVRYLPDAFIRRTVFVGIGRGGWRLDGGDWRIDHANERVVFDGAVLRSLDDAGETLTLTGRVPLPRARANGC